MSSDTFPRYIPNYKTAKFSYTHRPQHEFPLHVGRYDLSPFYSFEFQIDALNPVYGSLAINSAQIDGMSDEQLIAHTRQASKVLRQQQSLLIIEQVVTGESDPTIYFWTLDDFRETYQSVYDTLKNFDSGDGYSQTLCEQFEALWNGQFPKAGYVYCLSDHLGHYKLGMSKYLDKRIKQLGTQPPFQIELISSHYVLDAPAYERELHIRFGDKRLNGEWFSLSEEDVKEFVNRTWWRNMPERNQQWRDMPKKDQSGFPLPTWKTK